MVFSVLDFAIPGVVIPVAVYGLGLYLAFRISRKLVKKGCSLLVTWIPFIIFLVAFISTFLLCGPGYQYPIISIFQPDLSRETVVGQISQVTPVKPLPLYFNPVTYQLDCGQIVTVNDVQYFMLPRGLQVGQWVKLEWTTQAKVVRALDIISQQQAQEWIANPIYPQQTIQPVIYNPELGNTIACIFLAVHILLVLLQFPIGKRISERLVKMDNAYSGPIVPIKFGMIYSCISFVPIYGIVTGISIAGFDGAWLIGILFLLLFAYNTFQQQRTYFSVDGDKVVHEIFGKKFIYKTQEITQVYWAKSKIPHNRSLVITFRNGQKVIFYQESFIGLQSIHSKLMRSTGGGLREP